MWGRLSPPTLFDLFDVETCLVDFAESCYGTSIFPRYLQRIGHGNDSLDRGKRFRHGSKRHRRDLRESFA